MRRAKRVEAVLVRLLAISVALALVLTSAGCGVFGHSNKQPFVETMLSQVPDNEDNRTEIVLSDFSIDVRLTDDNVRWPRNPLFDPGALLDHRELGFEFTDVDRDVRAGFPPNTIEVIRGKDIDPDVIDRAVHADSTWKDVLQERIYAGERVYRWLDDGQVDPKRRSGARPSGESRRLAVDGHQLRWARTDKILEASIDAGHSKTKSLADDDTLRSVARALDGHHVYAAYLSADPARFGVDQIGRPVESRIESSFSRSNGATSAEMRSQLGRLRSQALRPWKVMAVGDAMDDGKAIGIIVIANADHRTARANATQLRHTLEEGQTMRAKRPLDPFTNRSYRDLFTIKSITTSGSLVVAMLSAGFADELIRMIVQRDPLFTHT